MSRRSIRFDAVSWTAWVERRHRAILLGSLVIMLASASSLTALRLDADVLSMLPVGAPAFDNFKTFVADFGELDELIVLIEGPVAETLPRFADAFAARLRGLDSVSTIDGRFDLDAVQRDLLGTDVFNYVPVDAYAELAAQLTPAGIDAQVAGLRSALQAPLDLSSARWIQRDPLGFTRRAAAALAAGFRDRGIDMRNGYVSTADGRTLLLFIRPAHNAFDLAFTTRLMAQVRTAEAAARHDTDGGAAVRVGYTGSYAFALEDAATLKWDVARYTLLALIGVLVVFYSGYRNLRILPFVTYPLLLSTVLTFVASLLCYAQLNAVSMAFAAILYGLSIDAGIYYYTRLVQELRHHDLRAAVARTLANLGGANIVASTTTAAAFFVIGFSQLAGISQLGFLTAIGMLINIVQFFVLYPALTFWMPRGSLADAPLDAPWLGRIAAACVAHARLLVVAVVALAIGAATVARRVGLDVDLTHLRPAATPASQVQDTISRRFGGDDVGDALLVRAPSLDAALQGSEALVAQLDAYRQTGLVRSVRGVTALLPSARTQQTRLARFAELPRAQIADELRAALARHGFRAELFAPFLDNFTAPHAAIVRWGDVALQPFAAVLARHVRVRGDRATVATYIAPAAGVSVATVAERLRHDLPHVEFLAAGRSLLQEELHRVLRRELVGFCVASFALNLLLVLGYYPRLGGAAALLLPEALVIVVLLAVIELSGMGIDPVNLIVIPLILGIGVDNCVYLGARYRRGESLAAAVYHGGRALALSALATMTGFGCLALSHYPALARMGSLAAFSLFLCLVAAITLLPALLALLAPQTAEWQPTPE